MKRRKFIGYVISGAAAASLWPLRRLQADDTKKKGRLVAIAMDKLEQLKVVGGHMTVEVKGATVILVRTEETKVGAYSPVCSHKACAVAYEPKDKMFHCGCHKSSFGLAGKPTGGPATEPLERFPTALKKGKLIIKLPDTMRTAKPKEEILEQEKEAQP